MKPGSQQELRVSWLRALRHWLHLTSVGVSDMRALKRSPKNTPEYAPCALVGEGKASTYILLEPLDPLAPDVFCYILAVL
jgi:hypothetical protein